MRLGLHISHDSLSIRSMKIHKTWKHTRHKYNTKNSCVSTKESPVTSSGGWPLTTTVHSVSVAGIPVRLKLPGNMSLEPGSDGVSPPPDPCSLRRTSSSGRCISLHKWVILCNSINNILINTNCKVRTQDYLEQLDMCFLYKYINSWNEQAEKPTIIVILYYKKEFIQVPSHQKNSQKH